MTTVGAVSPSASEQTRASKRNRKEEGTGGRVVKEYCSGAQGSLLRAELVVVIELRGEAHHPHSLPYTSTKRGPKGFPWFLR
jgi:hypothetical protein